MSKLKVAVLEDDTEMLDRLVRLLKSHSSVEVVASATQLDVFEERVRSRAPEALMLDIDIHGDAAAGLAIARRYKLPVLFISGRAAEDLRSILELKHARLEMPVEPLPKPFDADTLKRAVDQFVRGVDGMAKPPFVVLKDDKGDSRRIRLAEIVMIRVPGSDKPAEERNDKEVAHSEGLNREVLLTESPPFIALNLAMKRMEDYGFPKDSMIPISRSAYVNPERVIKTNGAHIVIEYMSRISGVRQKDTIKVAEGRLSAVKEGLQGG